MVSSIGTRCDGERREEGGCGAEGSWMHVPGGICQGVSKSNCIIGRPVCHLVGHLPLRLRLQSERQILCYQRNSIVTSKTVEYFFLWDQPHQLFFLYMVGKIVIVKNPLWKSVNYFIMFVTSVTHT